MKVLLGVDNDALLESVLATLRWCVQLRPDDEVTVVHVAYSNPWTPSVAALDPGWRDVARAGEEQAETALAEARRCLSAWGIAAEFLRPEGPPAGELLRLARDRDVDLIVVGARGRQERGFLLGSVSQKIKSLARADVLLVKRGAPAADSPFRAVLAVDGSAESLVAVRAFADKMAAPGARIHLLHALDAPPGGMWDVLLGTNEVHVEDLPAPLRERVALALSPAQSILRERGLAAVAEVRRGSPAVEILEAAARHQAHLVAMGCRGLGGLRGLLVGSVTQRVIRHGKTSVLVAHERSDGPRP